MATILSLLSLTAAISLPAAGLRAQNAPPLQASANTQATEKCTAATEGYKAVSAGDTLYLFNEANGGVWQLYRHTQPITKLHFAQGGTLYFSDKSTTLHRLDVATLADGSQAEATGVDCATFFIEGDSLFYTQISAYNTWLYAASLTDLSSATELYKIYGYSPALSAFDGDLYFLYGLNSLYRLDLDTRQASEVSKLHEGTTSLSIVGDTVYAATEGEFYGYTLADLSANGNVSLCTPTVRQTGAFTALSDDGETLYVMQENAPYTYSATDGALQAATGAFTRPTLNDIPVGNVKTEIAEGSGAVAIVKTNPQALLLKTTLPKEETAFVCQSAARKESFQALQIAQTNGYSLLAYRQTPAASYELYLTATSNLTPLSESVFDSPITGYLTSSACLTKLPSTPDAAKEGLALPVLEELARGEKITLLGEAQGLEQAYYKAQIGDTVGYVAKSHVSLFAGTSPATEEAVYGDDVSNLDAIWRLAYLLLGSVAICILSDFLILRKKSEE